MDVKSQLMDFLSTNDFITLDEALRFGVNKMALSRLVKQDQLFRPYRRIYTTSNVDWLTHPERKFAAPCTLYPDAIICGVSALAYYGLTDEHERKIWLAFPQTHRVVNQEYRIIYPQGESYSLGMQVLTVGSRKVRIYDCEKTIVDAFKFLPDDVALKALKGYLKRKDKNINKLIDYSRRLRKPLDETITVLMADE